MQLFVGLRSGLCGFCGLTWVWCGVGLRSDLWDYVMVRQLTQWFMGLRNGSLVYVMARWFT